MSSIAASHRVDHSILQTSWECGTPGLANVTGFHIYDTSTPERCRRSPKALSRFHTFQAFDSYSDTDGHRLSLSVKCSAPNLNSGSFGRLAPPVNHNKSLSKPSTFAPKNALGGLRSILNLTKQLSFGAPKAKMSPHHTPGVLYEDQFIRITRENLVIKNYYFPVGSKSIQISHISAVETDVELDLMQQQYLTWGICRSINMWWARDRNRANPAWRCCYKPYIILRLKKSSIACGFSTSSPKAVLPMLRGMVSKTKSCKAPRIEEYHYPSNIHNVDG